MSLYRYRIDLRSLKESDRERIYDLLDEHYVETNMMLTKTPHVYEFFMDESIIPEKIDGLPLELLHRVP